MSKTKIIIPLILLLPLILSGLVSCDNSAGQNNQGDTVGATPNGDVSSVSAPETPKSRAELRSEVSDGLVPEDFGGYEFKIFTPEEEPHMSYSGSKMFWAEEMNGDIVNDAMYKRNNTVEDRFNVIITGVERGNMHELTPLLQRSVAAGEYPYDVYVPHAINGPEAMSVGGYLYNWMEIPNIDFSKPWWNHDIIDSLTYNNRLFFGVSDLNFGNMGNTYALFFNKAFIQDFSLENPYELVESGKWTLDKLNEITKGIYTDLNGNGIADDDDRYGFSSQNFGCLVGFMYASGITSVVRSDEDRPVFQLATQKISDYVDKMIDLYYRDNRTLLYDNYEINIFNPMMEGRVFMQCDKIGEIIKLRGSDIDFGIVPYPKFDGNQQNYYTYPDAWGGLLCVPVNTPDIERTGKILEALSAESWKILTPAYYDVALGIKYLRDEESIGMLDIIYGGVRYDFGYVYNRGHEVFMTVTNIINSKNNTVASRGERIERTIQTYLDRIYESIYAN